MESDGCPPAVVIEPLPRGFALGTAVLSYGFAMLAPNVWLPAPVNSRPQGRGGQLSRPLRRANGRPVAIVVTQPSASRLEARVVPGAPCLASRDVEALRAQLVRMLRLRTADTLAIETFRKAAAGGLPARPGLGRLFRSPSLFEDLCKTLTLCNCGWGRTVSMNEALCREVGRGGAFPSAEELAACSPVRLRERCRVGYRAERLVRLAQDVTKGRLDLAAIEACGEQGEALKHVQAIYGFGPFAAKNAMQLLGHFEHIAADSETARHLRQARGLRRITLQNVQAVADRVYKRYAPWQFVRYWVELWLTYEARMGGLACKVNPQCFKLLTAAHMDVTRQPYATPPVTARKRPAAAIAIETAKRPRRLSPDSAA